MSGQSGFTLIEALASGILSTVIAGAILSLMNFTNNQVKSGSVQIRLAERQQIASEQIRKSASGANGAMMASEDSTQIYYEDTHSTTSPLSPALSEIWLFKGDLKPQVGYKLGPQYLMEGRPTSPNPPYNMTYKAFTIGTDTVYLDPTRSYFRVLQGRKGIVANLRYIHQPDVETDSLPQDSLVVLCRNRSWP